ncbi:hypothetical protein DFH94DRAFT_761800 [Russula ochroleuca]|uniref:Uncharacterized protein n=1 Tax=Russula ochroleuca TaxID=152965 RepID=A0A9P5K1V9_9AGAM|nr:hypothetical protein DFH94DRAFT_761800 [Russula ochroleuca]
MRDLSPILHIPGRLHSRPVHVILWCLSFLRCLSTDHRPRTYVVIYVGSSRAHLGTLILYSTEARGSCEPLHAQYGGTVLSVPRSAGKVVFFRWLELFRVHLRIPNGRLPAALFTQFARRWWWWSLFRVDF